MPKRTHPDDAPRHDPPPISSTVPELVAVRFDGITYLVPPNAVAAFRARLDADERRNASVPL